MIKKIELENWRSHRSTVLEFEKGTNVLVGVMGSGKSSVMDSLCYALFGTFPSHSSKKVSLDETILARPNKADSARVAVEFECAGQSYRAERSLSRGKSSEAKFYSSGRLVAGPKPRDVNREIESVLGIDFELFSRAIYSEQNQLDSFLKMPPGARKKKFDELLELEKYEAARANALSLQNTVKKSLEAGRQRLREAGETYCEKDERESLERVGALEKKIISLEAKRKSLVQELAGAEKTFAETLAKKKESSSLSESLSGEKARLAELSAQLEEYASKKRVAELSRETLLETQRSLEQKIGAEKDARKKCIALEKETSQLESRKNFFLEQLAAKKSTEPRPRARLEEALVLNSKRAEETEAGARELEALVSENEKQKGALSSAILESKNFQSELSSLGETPCPVCKRNIGEEHRQSLLAEAEQKITQFKKKLDLAENNLANITGKKKELEKKADACRQEKTLLEKSLEIASEIEGLEKQCSSLSETLVQKNSELESSKPLLSDSELEGLERQLYEMHEAWSAMEKKEKIAFLKKSVLEKEKRLAEIGFDEKKLEEARETLSEKKSGASSAAEGISSARELLGSVKKELASMEKARLQKEAVEKKISEDSLAVEKLALFSGALQSTQAELRTQLVESINHAMEDIWPRVYPYRDYSAAKIEASESDYELFVKNALGDWVRVEGILSGGERSAAALTIRIAFSLVLSQKLSWLILDEPTHNLDSNAVGMMSEMLRTHLPGLVEQVFVITHDRQLEKAATGTVYELSRKKDEFEQTRVAKVN